MTRSVGIRTMSDIASPFVVGIVFLAGWEAACRAFAIPSYLVPAPSLIAQTFLGDAPTLLHALWITLRVTLIAFALAVSIGTRSRSCSCRARSSSAASFPTRSSCK